MFKTWFDVVVAIIGLPVFALSIAYLVSEFRDVKRKEKEESKDKEEHKDE